MREREAYNNKSNVLVQAWHLCWTVSVKSPTIRCFSNTVAKVPCNCWERTFNIVVISTLGMTLSKKITITTTEVFLIQLFSYNVVSRQKIKMKTQNTMAPSYHSKVISTQSKGPHVSLIWIVEFSIISSCLAKAKVFFDNFNLIS